MHTIAVNEFVKQECIPVGCVLPAAVAVRGGGLHQSPPTASGTRPPPRTRHPPGPDTPPVNRITDTCKNITFPQPRLRAVIRFHMNICSHHNVRVVVEVDASLDGDGLGFLHVELPRSVQDDLQCVADSSPLTLVRAGQTLR